MLFNLLKGKKYLYSHYYWIISRKQINIIKSQKNNRLLHLLFYMYYLNFYNSHDFVQKPVKSRLVGISVKNFFDLFSK